MRCISPQILPNWPKNTKNDFRDPKPNRPTNQHLRVAGDDAAVVWIAGLQEGAAEPLHRGWRWARVAWGVLREQLRARPRCAHGVVIAAAHPVEADVAADDSKELLAKVQARGAIVLIARTVLVADHVGHDGPYVLACSARVGRQRRTRQKLDEDVGLGQSGTRVAVRSCTRALENVAAA